MRYRCVELSKEEWDLVPDEMKSYPHRFSDYFEKNGFINVKTSEHIYIIRKHHTDKRGLFVEDIVCKYKLSTEGMTKVNDLSEIFVKPINLPTDDVCFKIEDDTLVVMCLEPLSVEDLTMLSMTLKIPYNSNKHLLLV